MEYRILKIEEIDRNLFENFNRYQKVTQCYRKINGKWVIKNIAFIDDWSEKDYIELVKCLKNTIKTGGVMYGAFLNGNLKGFTSIENNLIGTNKEYADLSCIHVSEDKRGCGIGKKLFQMAVEEAKSKGAKKLYISAHSSVESQKFYKAMGCTEALEYDEEHVKREPCDCQLEYVL